MSDPTQSPDPVVITVDGVTYELHPPSEMERTLGEIARRRLGIKTIRTRGADGLDFHDLHVGRVRAALAEAFEAGRASAKE